MTDMSARRVTDRPASIAENMQLISGFYAAQQQRADELLPNVPVRGVGIQMVTDALVGGRAPKNIFADAQADLRERLAPDIREFEAKIAHARPRQLLGAAITGLGVLGCVAAIVATGGLSAIVFGLAVACSAGGAVVGGAAFKEVTDADRMLSERSSLMGARMYRNSGWGLQATSEIRKAAVNRAWGIERWFS